MVRLIEGQDNKIPVRVTSLIDYSGFSAKLELGSMTKTVSDLKSASASIEFSASEVDSLDGFAMGHLTVYNASNEVHMKMLVQFSVVASAGAAQGFQKISITIVSLFKYEGGKGGGGGGGGDDGRYVKRSDFDNISPPKNSTNSNTETIKSILDAAKGE